MVLKELIEFLEQLPPDQVAPIGFDRPHSYRGVYADLAFEPTRNITAGDMLRTVRGALGATFTAYKGGEYTMNEYVTVYVAEWGRCGEEIGPLLLAYMFGQLDTFEV
jgi:hypothetical protein